MTLTHLCSIVDTHMSHGSKRPAVSRRTEPKRTEQSLPRRITAMPIRHIGRSVHGLADSGVADVHRRRAKMSSREVLSHVLGEAIDRRSVLKKLGVAAVV